MDAKKWKHPATFYVLNINGMTKFGITLDWEGRYQQYKYEFRMKKGIHFSCTIQYREVYDQYWKAEFIETMLRRRLQPWAVLGTHEYIRPEVPIHDLIDCYHKLKKFFTDYNSFEHVKEYHTIGKLRYKLYKLYYIERKAAYDAINVRLRKE